MPGPTKQEPLFPDLPEDERVVAVNDRCLVRTQDGQRIVVIAAVPLAQYALGDHAAEAHAMVSLVEQGWADQNDVARAFGCSPRTVRRLQRRFESGGLVALVRSTGYPRGRPRAAGARMRLVNRLKAEGVSVHETARRLGVTPKAVRKLLRRLGWKPVELAQTALALDVSGRGDPNLSAFLTRASVAPDMKASDASPPAATSSPGGDPNLSAFPTDEALPVSFDTDPADRRIDRLFACLGLLDDAAPMFRAGTRVPRAGVLLAVPALVGSGVLACAHEVYGSIGPAFYGLRTSFVAMLLMALLRIKRPEALKEHAPDDLGWLLGLDRAPEVKTLRRKLRRLAAYGRATEFGRALSERRVAARGTALGFLYVDGHVRVYHGHRAIPKAHVARMRLAMPATTDYWVNESSGDPLFVVTAEANAGMTKMLTPILAEVRRLVGERRITIVFDRGGWSPRLFKTIIATGFDVLTYRKGRSPRVPRGRFHVRRATIEGREVRYVLADQRIRLLGGKLHMRQVTRLSDNGHQTPIVTSRLDLRDVDVAFRMFERWRQENFFKYLREEYALDALADYGVEKADPTREVPNPHWNALDAEIHKVRAEVARLSAHYGLGAFTDAVVAGRTMRDFKISNAPKGRLLLATLKLHADLQARRAKVPRRVPVQQVVEGEVIQLATERKYLTNLVKMVAYQAESDLVRMLTPHYKRADDEGRTLVQSALASAADIEVTDAELRVTLAPLSSAHRTRAIAAVCDELNRAPACFPGTRLRLRFGVKSPSA